MDELKNDYISLIYTAATLERLMSVLGTETGYNIGEKAELFRIISWCLLVEKLEEMKEPINPQRLTAVYVSQLNLPLGEVLDALHVDRIADRIHFLGMVNTPYEDT